MIAQIDWDMAGVLLGLLILILGSYGVLIGVVWKSHTKRDTETADRIFEKLDAQTGAFNDFRVKAAEDFITKDECQQHRETMKA